ncbi:MAG TPA: RodZ domain-containing protein, partial [Vicinamibacterales bacterium]
TVGDQHVLERLLNAGDRRVVDTPSDVTLRIGDPATFAFSINGKPARIPGASGKAVTVQLTKENYSRFLMH